jgi:hypothetical protein
VAEVLDAAVACNTTRQQTAAHCITTCYTMQHSNSAALCRCGYAAELSSLQKHYPSSYCSCYPHDDRVLHVTQHMIKQFITVYIATPHPTGLVKHATALLLARPTCHAMTWRCKVHALACGDGQLQPELSLVYRRIDCSAAQCTTTQTAETADCESLNSFKISPPSHSTNCLHVISRCMKLTVEHVQPLHVL